LLVRDTALSIIHMATYSIDLRQKILRACEQHLGSQRRIAHVFGVSLAFVEKVVRQHRTTGDIAPKPYAGGPKPHLDTAVQAVVRWCRWLIGAVRPQQRAFARIVCRRTGVRELAEGRGSERARLRKSPYRGI
jgi:hypothetical protein